jgi:class 3 adenylate cyclase
VGMASGRVTVGAVGSTSRMEYTAVGTAVNLATRLCSAAADGEILVHQSTAHLTRVDGLRRHTGSQVAGLARDQLVYVLDAASARAQAVPSPREPSTLRPAPGSTSS